MILVNFGCGEVYHRDWQNFDVRGDGREVRAWDVRRPLPFGDGTVDAVYHSHLLEHLDAGAARAFLGECFRILRPGGTIRIAVPDLEGIARAYVRALETLTPGGDATAYDWSRLELFDQIARTESGGEMAKLVRTLTSEQIAVVRARAGSEVDSIRRMSQPRPRRQITAAKIWLRARVTAVRALAMLLGGRQFRRAFDEGWFRSGGEIHRVMYDRVCLARLLADCGFVDARVVGAIESRIPSFARYELDAVSGSVRKPDSLFMEAVRP